MKLPCDAKDFFAQDAAEFEQLLPHVRGARSILEVGTRYGESLRRFAAVATPGARLVSVDLGNDPFTKTHETLPWLRQALTDLARQGFDVHFIEGNSHDRHVFERVRALGPFDFGFIDGDHSTAGAQQDVQLYGPLCEKLAMHDIAWGGVKPVWSELRERFGKLAVEYITPRSNMGIGVLLHGGRLAQEA